MSPFAFCFHRLRISRGIRQKDLSEKIGYEQSYVSAIERGTKGPPAEIFVRKVVSALELSEEETRELMESAELSQRKFVLPETASIDAYLLAHRFWERIETMHPKLMGAMIALLEMSTQSAESPHQHGQSIGAKRSGTIVKAQEESRM